MPTSRRRQVTAGFTLIELTIVTALVFGAIGASIGVIFSDGFESGDLGTWIQATAHAQATTVGQGQTRTITLTGTSPNGPPLTFSIVTPPALGSLGPLTPTGPTSASVDYTAPSFALGPDPFVFQVDDGVRPNTATVTVTVVTVTPPVATDQTLFTDEDVALVVTLTATDQEEDPLTFEISSAASPGALTPPAQVGPQSAQTTFTPYPDWNGTDGFQFTVDDGNGGTDTGTVQIHVQPVNDPPVAADTGATTARGVPVTVSLSGSDVEGDTLSFLPETQPAHGTLSAVTPISSTSAEITYTPDVLYSGSDSFDFRVSDPSGDSSLGAVTLTVLPSTDYTQDAAARGVWLLEEDIAAGGGAGQVDTRLDATAAGNHLTTDFDVVLGSTSPPQGLGFADFPGLQGAHLDRHNPNGTLAAPFLSPDFPGVVDSDYTYGGWVLLRTASAVRLIDMKVMRFEVTAAAELKVSHRDAPGTNHIIVRSDPVSTDQWLHTVVRFDRSAAPGQKLVLFIDGQPAAFSSSSPTTLRTTTEQFSLGSDIFGNGPLDGSMDEVFVFNRPLSDAEIEEIYLCRADGSGC